MPESTTILTVSGLTLDLANPSPESICWTDIVYGLSHQPRFSGQTPVLWTVAQHSVEVALRLRMQNFSPEIQWEGLLHDAEEAYPPGDVDRPCKYLPEMREGMQVQQRIRTLIENLFGLPRCKSGPVADADKAVLKWERLCMSRPDGGARVVYSPEQARFDFNLTALVILSELPLPAPIRHRIDACIPNEVAYHAYALGWAANSPERTPEAALAADLRKVFKRHGLDPDNPQFSQYIGAMEKVHADKPEPTPEKGGSDIS